MYRSNCSSATSNAHKHYRNLRALFRWACAEEPPLRTSPSLVKKDDAPHVPDVERPPLTDAQVNALLDVCRRDMRSTDPSTAFYGLRDLAIIWLFIASGPRRSGIGE